MSDKINADVIAELLGKPLSNAYQLRAKIHMEIVSDLRANPPKEKFRGELPKETQRRYYWQKKTGARYAPWDFICAYPMLAKVTHDCFQSREQVIRRYFSKDAKMMQKATTRKRIKDKSIVNLKAGSMIRVEMSAGDFIGQRGFITALHPVKGYRVTIWPSERWKSKVRRWCSPGDFETVQGVPLPPLPKIDQPAN